MARVRYEVVTKREGKDGKVFWNKIGVVFQTDKGFSLKLESVPVGWDGWASLFEPKREHSGDDTGQRIKPQPSDDAPPF